MVPRIAYADPEELDDPELRAALEHAMLHSTPRPEIQAVRARQPEVLRAFLYTWERLFKGGVVDPQLKRLCFRFLAQDDAVMDFDRFSPRERAALRWAQAIAWDADLAGDELWDALHREFSEPELVELGSFVGYIAGGQRWIRTLGLGHGEVLAETTVGLSPEAAATVRERSAG